MKTQLYKYDGTPLFEVIVDGTSTQDWSLMSDNKLSVSFELEECVVLTAGCYIDFDDARFYLLNEYKPTMICSSVWKYDLTLGDAASWLSITLALKTIDGENTPLFKYTAPAAEHAAIIVANLNRRMGTDQWKVGSVISTENIAIDYSGKYCSDVLQEIVDAKNTEWWIDGMTLNIGRAEFGESVTLGYMNGVLGDIVCDTAGDMRSYAYLFPIGSTRNIDPTKYGHDRLQLPSGLKSVPINPEQGVAELVEEAAFAHIYPRYEGTVSAVRYTTAKNEDDTSFLIYYIKDIAIPFNPNEFEIPGLVKHITFQSGELMGQEFEVNYSADSNEFELITRWTGDIQLPGGVLVPAVGDKYVVWNISMPDVYYTIASHELLDAARAYAADAIKDVSVYKVKLDYIDVQERGLKLRPGQRVRLQSDEYFASGYYDSRITRITRNITYPDELSVDISAVRVVGTLSRLQASIQMTENVVAQFSGQLPAIIKSNDDTSANDSSVYTSAKSEKEFLNKRKGGRVAAPVTFDEVTEFLEGLVAHKYIKIGNGYLKYNDELGVWEMVGDLVVTGAVTMFGSLSGFTPSTVTEAVEVDGTTIVKTRNSQGQWQLTAIGGGGSGGSGGGLTAAEVNALIEAALVPYALKTAIPTDNNQLSNSAGYITASALTGYASEQWVSNQGYAKQSSLDGVDNRLKSVETFFATSDTDNLVNKWSEIVAFLNATEGDTLDNILKTKANQSALDDAVASLTTEIGKKWTQNDAKIANWDAAYGWGNHANAGYAAKTYIDGELAKYVKLATAQDISAQHNFVNGLKIGGLGITKSQDDVIYVDANLVVRGAVTMFGSGATIAPSIWASIPFNDTMEWNGSEWGVAGGGSGSVNEATVNNLIYEYLTKNSYAKISDISSALTGYATQSWVRNNYLSLSGGSLLGGVTITAGNLIVSQGDTVVGNLYPTSDASVDLGQGVRRWKNIYLGGYLSWGNSVDMTDIGDWNTLKGNYGLRIISSITTDSGAPYTYATALHVKGRYGFELAVQGGDIDSFAIRSITHNREWKELIHSGNIGQQSVNYAASANEAYKFRTIVSVVNQLIDLNTECLGGGLVRNYAGPSYWKNAPDGLAYGMVLTFASGFSSTLQGQLAWDVNHASTADTTRNLWWRANDQTDFANSKWHQIAFTDSNVASATKLQTARSIWGQPFNGTDNIGYDGKSQWLFMNYNGEGIYITGDSISWHDSLNAWAKGLLGFAADGTVSVSNKLAVGRTTADYAIHIDGITKTRGFLSDSIAIESNSSGAMGSNSGEINRATGTLYLQYDNSKNVSLCYGGGNVAVGGTTANEKLQVYGNIQSNNIIPTSSGSYTLGTADNQWYAIYSIRLHSKAGSDLYIGANDSNNIVIRKNGNVAIGSTTADELLHVHGITKATLFKSVQGYTFPSSAAVYCGLVPNSAIISGGNSSDFWLYNTTDIKYQATNHLFLGGNVAVGGTTTSAKLHVYGDILATGAITMFSQLSMKNVIDYDGLSLAQLAQIRPARFTWKDDRDNRIHVGGVADYIQPIIPEVVYETVNKELTVDYGSAGFFIATSLIKPVIDHERRIVDLERENKQLKQQLEQLSAA